MAEVTFRSVSKQYEGGGPKAVHDLELDIKDGEFMVLVGPSGCGKSTALRMIAGLEEITEGELRIGDRLVNDVPPGDRDIAMVFQNYALYPHMTVRENIGFALEVAKVKKAEIKARTEEAAEMLGLTEYLDRLPKALSGGQRQRVAMGRAIVRSPQVFLMDEPLSNLDAKLRVQMRSEIIQIQKRLGTTMIYVTHDQIEAMTMGHRVAVMRLGVLQQVAHPQELYQRPANLFVAAFIGSPAMNLINVTLGGTAERPTANFAGHTLAIGGGALSAIRKLLTASDHRSCWACAQNTSQWRATSTFLKIRFLNSRLNWQKQWAPKRICTSCSMSQLSNSTASHCLLKMAMRSRCQRLK